MTDKKDWFVKHEIETKKRLNEPSVWDFGAKKVVLLYAKLTKYDIWRFTDYQPTASVIPALFTCLHFT